MSCTPARLLANQNNALKSTGPKTPEGKLASRRNALKHGLTGRGVVVPGDDLDQINERAEALEAELAPGGGLMSRLLVQKIAAMTVRTERCVRHETASLANRVRSAPNDFDEERRARADFLLEHMAEGPTAHHRRLMAMPEGLDLLGARLLELRAVLSLDEGRGWTEGHAGQLDEALGHRPGAFTGSRAHVLSEAILGRQNQLGASEVGALDCDERREWALVRLLGLIDSEVARLEAHRETLDLELIAISREESGERALFDPSHAATLARKYEASAERTMFKALKELREIQAVESAQPPLPRDPYGSTVVYNQARPDRFASEPALGSFFPGEGLEFSPSAYEAEFVQVSASMARTVPSGRSEPTQRPETVTRSPRREG